MAIKVYIDQGHNPGNINAGASGNGVVESEVNYQVGIYLAEYLNADPAFVARVSRLFPDTVLGSDASSSLRERVYQANSWPADYFISIHTNSNVNPAIQGSEVYVYREFSRSYEFAQDVLASIVEIVGTKDNQVRINPSLYVLRNTDMPAILVELAYLSNPSDAMLLLTKQKEFAYAIYQGLRDYLGLNN
ncbi:N-acetylmuramoyl-L-alanine amidase family protein [Amedibacillus sp. YH-ame6]